MIGRQVGNYQVVRCIAAGGMGEVFEATHRYLCRRAAIKFILPRYASDPEIVGRLFNEARAVNLISHPSIVDVFECGLLQDGIAFLVMEYLEGETLAARLARKGRIAPPLAWQIGRQLASALVVTHRKGIIHRDIKPSNIMLVADEEDPSVERAMLLDFGIAKLAASSAAVQDVTQTRPGMILGTPAYMAPEQALDAGAVDEKVDVYALGAVLYHALTGGAPFEGTNLAALMIAHRESTPTPPQVLVADRQTAAADLVLEMLAKLPQRRPTMREVLLRLPPDRESSAVSQPLTIGEPAPGTAGRKPGLKRAASGWPGFGVLITAVVLGLATLVYWYRPPSRSHSRARAAAADAIAPPPRALDGPPTTWTEEERPGAQQGEHASDDTSSAEPALPVRKSPSRTDKSKRKELSDDQIPLLH